MLLNAILPTLRGLRKKGKAVVRKRRCGVRGTVSFKDEWYWPTGQKYLFPDRTGKSHIKKDVVCHAIQQARKSFRVMDSHKIRSHSGRHSTRQCTSRRWHGFCSHFPQAYLRLVWPAESVASGPNFKFKQTFEENPAIRVQLRHRHRACKK